MPSTQALVLTPGTELAFKSEAEYDHPLGRLLPSSRFRKIGQTVARFRQIDLENPYKHHDALEFGNGKVVLVTRLCLGQHATVLQLPARAQTETTKEARKSAITPAGLAS